MPDVLHVLIVIQHIQKLRHAADIVLTGHDNVVLGNHLDLRTLEGIALLIQRLDHVVEAVRIGGDLKHGAVGLHILGAGIQRVHHHGILVQLALFVVNDDHALAVKGPADAALSTHALAEFVKIMADLGCSALTVVGQRLHDDSNAAGAVALVGDRFIVIGIAGTQCLVDGALDVVVGHIGCLGLGDNSGQAGVVVGVAAAALLDGHDDLLGDLGECGAALGVGRPLGLLNIVPLGMS